MISTVQVLLNLSQKRDHKMTIYGGSNLTTLLYSLHAFYLVSLVHNNTTARQLQQQYYISVNSIIEEEVIPPHTTSKFGKFFK